VRSVSDDKQDERDETRGGMTWHRVERASRCAGPRQQGPLALALALASRGRALALASRGHALASRILTVSAAFSPYSFQQRALRFPDAADLTKVEANVDNGVLRVCIAKRQEAQGAKRQTIKVA
jgi:hypothetical protein